MKIVEISWRGSSTSPRETRTWSPGDRMAQVQPEWRLVVQAIQAVAIPDTALDLEIRVGWKPGDPA